MEGLAHLMMKILGPLLQLELNTDILKIFIENLVLMSSLQIDDIYLKTQRLDVHSHNVCLPFISFDKSYV